MSKGALIASAVAAMVMAVGCSSEDEPSEASQQASQSVKCQGINECAGKGECAGTNVDGTSHDCQGLGSCKGQGWVTVPTAQECSDKGGTVLEG